MRRALGEYVVGGIRTNLPFHERLLEHPEFIAGEYDTGFIERNREALLGGGRLDDDERSRLAAAVAVAAFRAQAVSAANGVTKNVREGLSPWVAAHRAQLGRGR
jgi:acetyl-CoA carboxylase biotin carboxylase subunit